MRESTPLLFAVTVCVASATTILAATPGGSPPEGSVHPGEWEDMRAQILTWPIGSSSLDGLFCELVDRIQEHNEVWITVEDQQEQDYVEDELQSRGVPLVNVFFIHEENNSIWVRDYGPAYLRTPLAEARIADVRYYTSRPDDDVVPYRIGARERIRVHEAPLTMSGGNFQSDGHGHCFFSDHLYARNSSLTPEEVHQVLQDYYGCTECTALQPLDGEPTRHIDMFAKLVSPSKWLVGEYPPDDPNHQVLEDNAALLAGLTAHDGQPYEVVRIPMPRTTLAGAGAGLDDLPPVWDPADPLSDAGAATTWRTHTNSSIADALVLVPVYGKGTDAEALQIYQEAMPGHVVVGVDSEKIIDRGGAIHCLTKEVPEYPAYEGLAFHSIENLAEVVGNGNGSVDPGETWQFDAVIENRGSETAAAASARVVLNASVSGAGMLEDSSGFGDVPGGATASSLAPYRFSVDGSCPCGEALWFDLIDVESSRGADPDQPRSLALTVGDETVVPRFFDDMESGVGEWTHGPIEGAADLWHAQSDPGCFPAESPVNQWAFVEASDCDYRTGARVAGHLTSGIVPGITASSRLDFDYWRESDFCDRAAATPESDFLRVEVSGDAFASSTTVLDLSCKNPSHAQWLAEGPHDLSALAGETVQVRFVFDSDTSSGNAWRGIGIDDVRIEDRTYACDAFTPSPPGEVPAGPHAPGDPLTVAMDGGEIVLAWDAGCNAEGYLADYAVYRGNLSSLASGVWDHAPVVCDDAGGDRTERIDAGTGSYYFLVVPHDGVVEGSGGWGAGGERPASSLACRPAGAGSCGS